MNGSRIATHTEQLKRWFIVKIIDIYPPADAAVTTAPPSGGTTAPPSSSTVSATGYAFDEWWVAPTGKFQKKDSGRFGRKLNPGYPLPGFSFKVGDFALACSSDGGGGQVFELMGVGAAGAGTDTTTTTGPPAPCSGLCKFQYFPGGWVMAAGGDTCAPGCGCFYPDFCPTAGCAASIITYTNCFSGIASPQGQPPYCPGPGPTTTTTAMPGCTAGNCTWKTVPIVGWVKIDDPCHPSCPCAKPPGNGAGNCSTATTPCKVPVIPPCQGNCDWIYTESQYGWVNLTNNCSGGTGLCTCAAPTHTPACGTMATTPCVGEPGGGGGGGTTAPPGVCVGRCYFCWNGTAWTYSSSTCVGCFCPFPDRPGLATGEIVATACTTPTTTTTTTTTSTTTTTTTMPHLPTQCWCYTVTNLDPRCPPPAITKYCVNFDTANWGGNCDLFMPCNPLTGDWCWKAVKTSGPFLCSDCPANCPGSPGGPTAPPGTTPPPGTTTPRPTTTPPPGTTPPPPGWYCWSCTGPNLIGCSPTNPATGGQICTPLSGPYSSSGDCNSFC